LYSDGVGGGAQAAGTSPGAGDTVGFAYDPANGKLWIATNNTWIGGGDPVANTSPTLTGVPAGAVPFVVNGTAGTITSLINFGQGGQSGLTYDAAADGYFKYTPPSGFKALNSANMVSADVSPIHKPKSYFDAVTYTGNGTTQVISSLNFQPDLLWIKNRTSALDHVIFGDGSSGSTAASFFQWFEF
jgi:hypothetical protein